MRGHHALIVGCGMRTSSTILKIIQNTELVQNVWLFCPYPTGVASLYKRLDFSRPYSTRVTSHYKRLEFFANVQFVIHFQYQSTVERTPRIDCWLWYENKFNNSENYTEYRTGGEGAQTENWLLTGIGNVWRTGHWQKTQAFCSG
jgi:hypothetical protein